VRIVTVDTQINECALLNKCMRVIKPLHVPPPGFHPPRD